MRNLMLAFAILISLTQCDAGGKSDAATTDSNASAQEAKPAAADTLGVATLTKPDSSDEAVQKVKAYLQKDLRDDLEKGLVDSSSRSFRLAEYDLNNDGKKEIFVALQGMYFCGSGGCTFLLLQNDGTLITRFTVTEYPIMISDKETKDWKNLMLESRAKLHEMKYNGKAYPSNPSVQPLYAGDNSGLKQLFTTDANETMYIF